MARSRFIRSSDRPVLSGPANKKQRVYTKKTKTYMKKPGRTDILKIVKNVLGRNIETELVSYNFGTTQFNSGIDGTGDVNRVLPLVPQGFDDGTRKGSVIMAKSLNIKGHMMLNAMDTPGTGTGTYSPNSRICARLLVVTPKRFPSYVQSQANATTWLPNLLRNGVTTQGFTGLVQDLYLPINTDEVTVHWDQVFDLQSSIIQSGSGATLVPVVISPDKSYAFFNFNIKCRDRRIHFVDGTSDATDFGPVVLVGYAHMDNSAPDVAQTRLTMAYNTLLKYTDA